jgi:hypothetical protein
MSYTPIIIALEVKHGLFSKGIFGWFSYNF